MANAYRDENNVPTMIGVLNTDGETVERIKINSTTHALAVDDDITGSDNGPSYALKDENMVSTLLAVSSIDGETLVPLYVDSNGKLLIDSS